ncbi:Protoporphyrinogen oxidase [Microbacterium lemovicicum]|uniref:Coproporphyrinogen III oxidase n=2 Tax=Microbacterium lemovicicum TaxID=1072463 RepID=A0A3S9WED6_9MICO|nr:protoporphyrinogen oxidase [Microbacterium lemovicicum]AZS38412.1 Protoporphyrinogen oxidase [Microbacterium lemovicicum]
MTDVRDLAAAAARTSVVVVGGGMAGLVAAYECAKVGIRVTVVEASDRVGGVLRADEIDGIVVDTGAESYATRGGTVRALVDDLGLAGDIVTPTRGGAWVSGLPGGQAAPLPGGSLLGIPDNPWADDVRRVIGWGGAWRAYLDRLRPPLTIGHQRSLGALVRTRMGPKVLDRLVAPVTSGVYSARPDDVDVDIAAPGLNAALTRTGSLSGAVAALKGERTSAPGSAVEGIDGGMARLPAALRTRLEELGVDVRTSTAATAVRSRPEGGWLVAVDTVAAQADPAGAAELSADAVIVATTEAEARRLLAPVVPGLEREDVVAPVVEVVTLVLDAPALDARPRGSGVLTVPGSHIAKALTHSTAKWEWVARAAGARHVVRVSFGAQGEAPATEGMDDADAAALALSEASALLGVALAPAALRGAHRQRWTQSQPASEIGRIDRQRAARAAIHAVPGLAAAGAWLSGTGLAQVVPDAAGEAERVRAAVLFGAPDAPSDAADDGPPSFA